MPITDFGVTQFLGRPAPRPEPQLRALIDLLPSSVSIWDQRTGSIISECYDGLIWQGYATGAPGSLPIRI